MFTFSTDLKDNMPDFGLLFLRMSVGLFIVFGHGWDKLMNFGTMSSQFPDPIGLGSTISLALTVFAEVFCGLAFALGLVTRFSALPLIIMMLVAAAVQHADDPWQKKEFALLYLIPFVTVFLSGPGKYSLDRILFKNK
ncbi:MAG: DoxX family protein [candidate division Zixibacteria bacterium]|nr:DoxX family protein [candidate division Zixibacteria bacterium]